jgi:dienelactone hydrolase
MTEADRACEDDDLVSARRAYLRASEYYRQSFFFARTDLDDAFLHTAYAAHVNAFRSARPLLTHPSTPMEIITGGVVAQGYLFMPDDSGQPRPTVIAPAGYDSTAEAGYGFTAMSALEHGMNCLVFEGPGQGGVLYERRLPLRPDFEAVLSPVINWLLTQNGVDPDTLVLFGRSFAGYLAPRGATTEHRVAALICDPAQYDFAATVRKQAGEHNWARLQANDPTLEADLAPFLAQPHARNGFQWRMTAHGVDTMADYLRELSRFSLVGLADRITCPTLALAGEGDFAGTGQLPTFAAALTAPVTAHEFTVAEGAGGHCEGLGQDRLDQVAFGWLHRVLATQPMTR